MTDQFPMDPEDFEEAGRRADELTGGAPRLREVPRDGLIIPSRSEMRRRRRAETDSGVPFYLEHDDITVRVKLLSFVDRSTILGLPAEMQENFIKIMQERNAGGARKFRSVDEWSREMAKNEDAVNALCVLGFVRPKLVMPGEPVLDEDTWVVTDVHSSDRLRYFTFVSGGDKEGLDRARKFLRAGLAGLEDHEAVGGRQLPD